MLALTACFDAGMHLEDAAALLHPQPLLLKRARQTKGGGAHETARRNLARWLITAQQAGSLVLHVATRALLHTYRTRVDRAELTPMHTAGLLNHSCDPLHILRLAVLQRGSVVAA